MIKAAILFFILILNASWAAAAAGWYLLLPPGPASDESAPLKLWERFGAYDSASECEKDRLGALERL